MGLTTYLKATILTTCTLKESQNHWYVQNFFVKFAKANMIFKQVLGLEMLVRPPQTDISHHRIIALPPFSTSCESLMIFCTVVDHADIPSRNRLWLSCSFYTRVTDLLPVNLLVNLISCNILFQLFLLSNTFLSAFRFLCCSHQPKKFLFKAYFNIKDTFYWSPWGTTAAKQ